MHEWPLKIKLKKLKSFKKKLKKIVFCNKNYSVLE